jgi:hypothetical protein
MGQLRESQLMSTRPWLFSWDRKTATHHHRLLDLVPLLILILPKLLTEHYGTDVEHIELGYHIYRRRGTGYFSPDWLVETRL